MSRKTKPDPSQINLLDQIQQRTCSECGGTILPPTIGGVPRGTCHCIRERVTDWSAERVKTVKGQEPKPCCRQLIECYESIDREFAEVAKSRGGVALFCPGCKSRVTFADGRWQREGDA